MTVRTDDEEHLGGAAAVAAVEEPDALPLVAVRVPAHLAVRHCCSPAALPPPPRFSYLLEFSLSPPRAIGSGFDRLGSSPGMGVGWKARIEKRGREKTRGWERSFGGRGRLFIAVGRRRTGAARGRRAGGVPEARNTWMDGRADMSGDGDTSARRRLLSRTGWASGINL